MQSVRRTYVNAGLSAASAIPIVGDAAKVAKYGSKAANAIADANKGTKVAKKSKSTSKAEETSKKKTKKDSCNCFTAGTKVLTDEGEKPIEEIEVGDRVLAKDDVTGEKAYKEVEWLFERDVEETYNITVGGEVITTTDEHPFWIVGKGWVEAQHLVVGDVLTTSDGKELAIEKLEVKREHATVYNFKVKDFRTYFVSNLGIWTHNSCWGKMSPDDLRKLAQADQKDIKAIKGNADDAWNFFKAQVNGSTIKEVKSRVFVGKDSNGVTFTYRSESTYGKKEPTININGISGIRKIKFID